MRARLFEPPCPFRVDMLVPLLHRQPYPSLSECCAPLKVSNSALVLPFAALLYSRSSVVSLPGLVHVFKLGLPPSRRPVCSFIYHVVCFPLFQYAAPPISFSPYLGFLTLLLAM
jgi:hypothetical protein